MRKGFSLVELSITLVIIGLLVGGVFVGQSLVRASELRSINVQAQTFAQADRAFREKYLMQAGDFTGATAMWGAAATPANCMTTVGTGTQTCDGDGDGYVNYSSNLDEPARYWQQLVNAGYIAGSFSGVSYAASPTCTAVSAGCVITDKTNAPAGKIANSVWLPFASNTIMTFTDGTATTIPFRFEYFQSPNAWNKNQSPILTTQDMYNLDLKVDDGKPNAGSVQAGPGGCIVDGTVGADYALTATGKRCEGFFYTGDIYKAPASL